MPRVKHVEPTIKDWTLQFGPSADRADKRSVTPAGFAQAVFESNHNRKQVTS